MSYLVAAYIAVWVVIFVYLFSLHSRQRSLQKDIDNLKKLVGND